MTASPTFTYAEFGDIEQIHQVHPGWRLVKTKIDQTPSLSCFRQLDFGDLFIIRDTEKVASISDYQVPDDTTKFLLLAPDSPTMTWCGYEFGGDVCLINPSARDYLGHVIGGYDAIAIVIPNNLVTEYELLTDDYLVCPAITTKYLVNVAPEADGFRRWLFDAFASVDQLSRLVNDPPARSFFRDRVLAGLSLLLDSGIEQTFLARSQSQGRVNRYRLARQAYQMIIDHYDEDLNTLMIARELGASPRLLRVAFQQVLGTTPHRLILKRKNKLATTRQSISGHSDIELSKFIFEYGLSEFNETQRTLVGKTSIRRG